MRLSRPSAPRKASADPPARRMLTIDPRNRAAHHAARFRLQSGPGAPARYRHSAQRAVARCSRLRCCAALLVGAIAPAVCAQFPAAPPGQSTPAPASAPAGARPFQPGVAIDWTARRVFVDGSITLREGPLEYFACFSHKAHESIIELSASAQHVYMALGLIGLQPGNPPQWDEAAQRFTPPSGELVDVGVQWEAGNTLRSAPAFDWLLRIEYTRPAPARPWVFGGSRPAGDARSADRTGSGVALVQDPDALLSLSRNRSDRTADLWAQANTPLIPPLATPVRVIFSAAAVPTYDMRLDFRGELFVDGLLSTPAEAADLIELARRLRPDAQEILAEAGLRTDSARLLAALERCGLPREAVRLRPIAPHPGAPASGPAADASPARRRP